jgi:ParB-like nuclease domain
MIKCFFVDVKSIKSDLPKSNFVESELEQLADLILATDGLLRPLILKEIKPEKYQVIEGHREYYAAVRAKEKNIAKAEMVNAFIIDTSIQKSAISQLALLLGQPTLRPSNETDDSSLIDRILPLIESKISQQVQPLVDQITNHEEILDKLTSPEPILPLIESAVFERFQLISEQFTKHKELLDTLDIELNKLKKGRKVKPPKSTTSKQTEIDKQSDIGSPPIASGEEIPTQLDPSNATPKSKTKSTTNNKKTAKTIDTSPSINVSSEEQPKPPEPIEEVTITKLTEATTKTQPPSTVLASIDPTKATTVLNLINTLDRQQLAVSMERSGLKTSVKLVPTIIEYRNNLSGGKIDSWETVIDAKITGLSEAAVKKIIDKLK